jgi:5-methylthioadenosine/S-adenosylhomocysteine deaminase
MLSKGINVSLGTDGKSSNDSQDMYEVVKTVALLHNTQQPEFERWLGAPESWHMGTVGGAQSVGLRDELGRIEVGQRADLVFFDLNTIPFIPFNNPLHQLVYCLPSSAVRTVMVEGEVVVEDGRMASVDEQALLREGNELGRAFVARNEATFEISRQIFPAVAAGYRHAVAQDVGVRRHIGNEV